MQREQRQTRQHSNTAAAGVREPPRTQRPHTQELHFLSLETFISKACLPPTPPVWKPSSTVSLSSLFQFPHARPRPTHPFWKPSQTVSIARRPPTPPLGDESFRAQEKMELMYTRS